VYVLSVRRICSFFKYQFCQLLLIIDKFGLLNDKNKIIDLGVIAMKFEVRHGKSWRRLRKKCRKLQKRETEITSVRKTICQQLPLNLKSLSNLGSEF
jgi:hypothetical protein